MKSYGFTEAMAIGPGLSDSILFDKNDYRLRPDIRQQIARWFIAAGGYRDHP